MSLRYLSVCAGIEAASVAWEPLGFEPVAFSEIDAFPCAVLAHHYPSVPNWGDMTRFQEWPDAALDLLVGGTPCQSFSVAGLRKGLADPRGNLALTFLAIAERYRPRWVVWENVPGVLSSTSHEAPDPRLPPDHLEEGSEWVGEDEYDADESHAFACFLAGLSELGYGFAYRSLDAQYAGLAQRRERVFVVGHLGDWRRAAAVLFERHSLSGHPPPRREAGQVAPTVHARCTAGGGLGTDWDCDGGLIAAEIAAALETTCHDYSRADGFTMIAHSLRADGFDASEDGTGRGTPLVPVTHALDSYSAGRATEDGTGRGCPLVPVAFSVKDHGADAGDIAPTLRAGGHTGSHANGGVMPAVAFDLRGRAGGAMPEGPHDTANIRAASGGSSRSYIAQPMAVRRLTPRECERLQGFPDDWTLIPYRGKPAADGPRYKALGNSMAVPVVRWIGRRMQEVDAL